MKFFRVPFNHDEDSAPTSQPNKLHEYIQSQSMQDMARLASEITPQVKQIIAGNVQSLLGYLPNQEFQTTVAAEKSSFQNLLASAMVTGYFMHAMENRMKMESLFTGEEVEPTADKVFGPEPLSSIPVAESQEAEILDPEQQMQNALHRLMQARLEEGTRRKVPLKKPDDLFGALIERHLKEIEQLDEADRLGDFVSGEALRKMSQPQPQSQTLSQASQAPPLNVPAKIQDTVKIQLEINTEMGQKSLTDLLRALGTLGPFEKE